MKVKEAIPIIDLFAGSGGLGEGFSSFYSGKNRAFDIKLSIEKDENAHKTLQLRAFTRQFSNGGVPEDYYEVLREKDLIKREKLISILFERYPKQAEKAKNEAWLCELGKADYPTDLIDKRIKEGLNGSSDWLLIGGPPCQAYSMAGRSRVGGIKEADHRVFLYKEYLRVIAIHHPSVFVMENVKGLLSAKVNGQMMFDCILNDLQNPSSVFKKTKSPKYKVYSLSTEPKNIDSFGNPVYKDSRDFLIRTELFNVPQKRHRVILLGIREDIQIIPNILKKGSKEISLKSIISDLPQLRSGLGRSIISYKTIDGKKKRVYKNEIDSYENWKKNISDFQTEIYSWKVFKSSKKLSLIKFSNEGIGSEFLKCKTPNNDNPLKDWYNDDRLGGVCNHQSRTHMLEDLKRYFFASTYAEKNKRFPRLKDYEEHSVELLPDHISAKSGKFTDRFRVQMPDLAATTITSHISKDGHYFIHYDPRQCRSLTVREAARIQTFPDNYLFCGPRTAQYHQVGNAVPPYLAFQIAEIVNKIFLNKKK
ncbi:DNA cytosine methyltransferase [Vicingus serpentipes]|uniref:DNA (cytosine-5-)-methyltransferase n=1 Tax=Vicingus serpentipes TaxID=1926625 RepID=A0A5C6RUK1_9FLAO|nr:DNA (cytosine-5-)-methyltransferase [Vicingus serpentipes]TXB66176.1 DNA cytosine methyltransferase [Vicingus serpentipes]